MVSCHALGVALGAAAASSRADSQMEAATGASARAGLTAGSTKIIVDGVRARHPGWPLEMLIPMNAGAVARELAETGIR
jgi:hypothetical protein